MKRNRRGIIKEEEDEEVHKYKEKKCERNECK
jgi:hypothetical protein